MLEKTDDKEREIAASLGIGDNLEISLACVEAFIIASEHQSITEAARACGIKEPTFRKRLDALESWAYVSLLQRRPDLLLTPDGYIFLPFAKKACAAIRQFLAVGGVERRCNKIRGTIRKAPSSGIKRKYTKKGEILEID